MKFHKALKKMRQGYIVSSCVPVTYHFKDGIYEYADGAPAYFDPEEIKGEWEIPAYTSIPEEPLLKCLHEWEAELNAGKVLRRDAKVREGKWVKLVGNLTVYSYDEFRSTDYRALTKSDHFEPVWELVP